MTQEEKELLIRDLSARIPYKVKASYYGTDEEMECTDIVEGIIIENNDAEIIIGQYGLSIEKVKPYLFPLSSMTEEQEAEYNSLCEVCTNDWGNDMYFDTIDSVDWLNKNHFDYRGLISMGLAIDATGLNIY
jgi:hypothetical protein